MIRPMEFLPLLLLGAFLSACTCGEYRPAEDRAIDSTKAKPVGLYAPDSGTDASFRCDAAGKCSLVLRDDLDTNVRWTVQFALDSEDTKSSSVWRDL